MAASLSSEPPAVSDPSGALFRAWKSRFDLRKNWFNRLRGKVYKGHVQGRGAYTQGAAQYSSATSLGPDMLEPARPQDPREKAKICILSIDGGGVKGAIPAEILRQLETVLQKEVEYQITRDDGIFGAAPSAVKFHKYIDEPIVPSKLRIADFFDVMAGTSTGGLIVAMSALKGPASQVEAASTSDGNAARGELAAEAPSGAQLDCPSAQSAASAASTPCGSAPQGDEHVATAEQLAWGPALAPAADQSLQRAVQTLQAGSITKREASRPQGGLHIPDAQVSQPLGSLQPSPASTSHSSRPATPQFSTEPARQRPEQSPPEPGPSEAATEQTSAAAARWVSPVVAQRAGGSPSPEATREDRAEVLGEGAQNQQARPAMPQTHDIQTRYTAAEVIEKYQQLAAQIFPQRRPKTMWARACSWLNCWQHYKSASRLLRRDGFRYSELPLEQALKKTLMVVEEGREKHAKLNDLVTPIIIPTFDFTDQQALIWEGDDGGYNIGNDRLLYAKDKVELWQVCRATSAAPTYLPAMKVKVRQRPLSMQMAAGQAESAHSFIDGGMYANNPILQAFKWVLAHHKELRDRHDFNTLKFEEMLVLSLGTGQEQKPELNKLPSRLQRWWRTVFSDPKDPRTFSTLDWIFPAVEAAMSGSSTAAHQTVFEVFLAHNSLPGYLRLQPRLPPELMAMDDADNVDALITAADKFLGETAHTECPGGLPPHSDQLHDAIRDSYVLDDEPVGEHDEQAVSDLLNEKIADELVRFAQLLVRNWFLKLRDKAQRSRSRDAGPITANVFGAELVTQAQGADGIAGIFTPQPSSGGTSGQRRMGDTVRRALPLDDLPSGDEFLPEAPAQQTATPIGTVQEEDAVETVPSSTGAGSAFARLDGQSAGLGELTAISCTVYCTPKLGDTVIDCLSVVFEAPLPAGPDSSGLGRLRVTADLLWLTDPNSAAGIALVVGKLAGEVLADDGQQAVVIHQVSMQLRLPAGSAAGHQFVIPQDTYAIVHAKTASSKMASFFEALDRSELLAQQEEQESAAQSMEPLVTVKQSSGPAPVLSIIQAVNKMPTTAGNNHRLQCEYQAQSSRAPRLLLTEGDLPEALHPRMYMAARVTVPEYKVTGTGYAPLQYNNLLFSKAVAVTA